MPPNVLLLVTDQQSRAAQGVAGNPWVRTPNLDALAARGTRFRRAYCAAPVCSPSRSSLDTGRPPHETGVLVNGPPRREGLPEAADLFHDAGYAVAWAGARKENRPSRSRHGRGAVELLLPDGPPGLAVDTDPLVTRAAIDFLRRPHEQPFFLTVPLLNPHDICYWVMRRAADTAPADGALPPLPAGFASSTPEADFVRRCRARSHYGAENTCTTGWDDDQWRRYLREYYALTERVDGEAGRILDVLADTGLEDETLVLFTADHGEGMARHRWVVKLMFWESIVGVPLTLAGPGVPRGQVCDHLASGLDVTPTLCDLAGAPYPADLTGCSLRPLLEAPGIAGREAVVVELHPDTEDLDFAARIVVTQRHKYVAFSVGQPRESLFDLEADPGELHDLAGRPDCAAVLDAHRAHLRRWLDTTGDTFAPMG